MIKYDTHFFDSDHQISYIGSGSPGGKAQGLVLINGILREKFNKENFPEISVTIPRMIVIRSDIFDAFMQYNNLYKVIDLPDDRIAMAFQKAGLPFEILGDLRSIVSKVHEPLAVRSSGILEDAIFEPFAGIYGTKMTPNNQHDIDTRFKKLTEAIKFVYASTFFRAAREYMKATNHNIEDEKMAVIIQEVVGTRHNDRFYPEVSGVARSYNFYPFGHAKPENGVVNLALGLGKTIVDGGVSWSYSPAFPRTGPPFNSTGDMLKHTQTEFWAVNMGKPPEYDPTKETEYLILENITEAEKDGALKHIVSTYDPSSDMIWPGQTGKGPRILNFSPLLVTETIPFNNLIKTLLLLCEKEYNGPVEIEFALTFSQNKKSGTRGRFGFLQVRPMVVSTEEVSISREDYISDNLFIASGHVLGNGIIRSIRDIVYFDPDHFDTTSTLQMADDIAILNKKLLDQKRPYLLIGVGRWGTSDPTAGIPVQWGQISGARVIVETSKDNLHAQMSQGSHFFHNVTSFKIFYFSLSCEESQKIDWNWLSKQERIEETRFFKHVRSKNPLTIKVDGRTGRGIILF